MTDVSVVIVNWNGRERLRACLESLYAFETPREVIVVDNGSTDGSVAMLSDEFPQVVSVRLPGNARFARANNIGIARAQGHDIFLLNNDTLFTESVLKRLADFLASHPSHGMVGPQLRNPDGSLQPSCHGFVSLRTHCFDMLGLDMLFPRSQFFAAGPCTFMDYSVEQDVEHVMAAAVLIRRDALKSAGGFDEAFSLYYNDLDLSRRFLQAGWKTAYVPWASIIHEGGATTRTVRLDDRILNEMYANVIHYYRKHFGAGAVVIYRLMLFAGFLPRTFLWSLLALLNSSEDTRYRMKFSVASLRIALTGTRP